MSVDHLRTIFLKVSDDVRVVLIALCSQCFTLEHSSACAKDNRIHLCREALRLYAPVAARLGIYTLKHRIENAAFPHVYPTDAERIREQLAAVEDRHGPFLGSAAESLLSFLRTEGVAARVEVRQKQPFSIFNKMKSKSITHIEDLYDLFAIRVIVRDEAMCYQVLGLLHRIGHPVGNRFKDYIAFPKPNGYQSLHTTLARLPGVPGGIFAEVQIRTETMHREAEYGIAAHWSYKEGGSVQQAARKVHLHRLLADQQPIVGDGTKMSLHDQIFVLTPKGDVIELPEGATPLDFAFAVHTDLGIAFKSARVNGSIVPMDYELENGDIVEVAKQREPRPSPRWITLLRTASARSRLKRYLFSQNKALYMDMGKSLLNGELKRRGMAVLDPDLSVLRLLDGGTATLDQREEFLQHLGEGTLKLAPALRHIDGLTTSRVVRTKFKKALDPAIKIVQLDAEVDMPYRFAKCCKPEEGKKGKICGIVGRAGLRIHRSDCRLLKSVNPERRVGARWE